MIRSLQETTGGFGTVLGFCHDWADREATLRSWELFARYVIPEIHGTTRHLGDFWADRPVVVVFLRHFG